MRQEYLFTDLDKFEEVEKYKVDEVEQKIYKIEGTECFIVKYSLNGDKKKNAKILSKIDEEITEKFLPIVLTNDSSKYYNKMLYPYINEFERKLRCFLYLKSAIAGENEYTKVIHDLESKDFGEIYELLFTDRGFTKDVKEKIKKMNLTFSKQELFEIIKEIKEETLWNKLIDDNILVELKNNFLKVKQLRNDVMHAHNIHTKDFFDSKNLFQKINLELDEEIKKLKEEPDECMVKSEFNKYLFETIIYNDVYNNTNIITIDTENKFDILEKYKHSIKEDIIDYLIECGDIKHKEE